MENLYSEIDVSPEDVEYIEANATGYFDITETAQLIKNDDISNIPYFIAGLAEADANEVEAIAKVFSKKKPIKIGSVKSNMGHTQAVSGACSLTKVFYSYIIKFNKIVKLKIKTTNVCLKKKYFYRFVYHIKKVKYQLTYITTSL